MWDFSFGKSVGMVLRTLPFLLLRIAVYLGIAIIYIFAAGIGAAFGFALGHMGADADSPVSGAFIGGAIGFGLTAIVLYFLRQYLLYLVKAAHIAVLVEILDGRSIPAGQGQIGYGVQFVKNHFAEASVLFGVDQVVKAILRALFRIINLFTMFLPIPLLGNLIRIAEAVVRNSLTYVDEVILAYLIRTRTTNPWETAKDGVILYAQNYRTMLKNAVWLSVFMWGMTLLIFALLLAPAAGFMMWMPGTNAVGIWAFMFAVVVAVALKKALLEPLAIASLMQVYFKVIEGQKPDPEWSARLDGASRSFRELGQKAAGWVPRPPMPEPGAPT
jgi:hypothetical protein